MFRRISVTARYIEFLFTHESEEPMYAREEVRDIFRRILVEDAELLAALADGPLPTTDDDHVGDD